MSMIHVDSFGRMDIPTVLSWVRPVLRVAQQSQFEWILLPRDGAFDLGLAVSVPLPIVTGIFVLLWFQSRLT